VGLRVSLGIMKRKVSLLLELEPRLLGHPACSLVAIQSELSQLPKFRSQQHVSIQLPIQVLTLPDVAYIW
jgi:hypothetical protein